MQKLKEFSIRKQCILNGLYNITSNDERGNSDVKIDRSLKGKVDDAFLEFVELMNEQESYVTTSCCSGRISIYRSGEQNRKFGGALLFVSHEIIPENSFDEVIESLRHNQPFYNTSPSTCMITPSPTVCNSCDSQSIYHSEVFLKMEPFVIHIECATIIEAQFLLQIGLSLGYKNSGAISIGPKRYIVALRGCLKIDAPLYNSQGEIIIHDAAIPSLLRMCNEKLMQNEKQIHLLTTAVREKLPTFVSNAPTPFSLSLKNAPSITFKKLIWSSFKNLSSTSPTFLCSDACICPSSFSCSAAGWYLSLSNKQDLKALKTILESRNVYDKSRKVLIWSADIKLQQTYQVEVTEKGERRLHDNKPSEDEISCLLPISLNSVPLLFPPYQTSDPSPPLTSGQSHKQLKKELFADTSLLTISPSTNHPKNSHFIFVNFVSTTPALPSLSTSPTQGRPISSAVPSESKKTPPIIRKIATIASEHLSKSKTKHNEKEWLDHLLNEAPRKYELVGDALILSSLTTAWQEHISSHIWSLVSKALSLRIIGTQNKITQEMRHSGVQMLNIFDANDTQGGWTLHKENGVAYRLDVLRLMFSSGNGTERRRLPLLVRKGEVLVDLFCGIGYFTLPSLLLGHSKRLVACDLNQYALESFLSALPYNKRAHGVKVHCNFTNPGDFTVNYRQLNYLEEAKHKGEREGKVERVETKIKGGKGEEWLNETALEVYCGDSKTIGENEDTSHLIGTATRVFLGLIPTSRPFWNAALRLLSRQEPEVFLHIHENACSVEEVKDMVNVGLREEGKGHWDIEIVHVENVKAYAPRIFHYVVDVKCRYIGL